MWGTAIPVSMLSAAVFAGLALMTDRKRGAFLAQCGFAVAGACILTAVVIEGPVLGLDRFVFSAMAVGMLSASGAGMLYHLYLGRFTDVWVARGLFTLIYLAMAAGFGLILLSLL